MRDALCESGGGFGEVAFEAYLQLEVGEDGLDHEPDPCLGDLAGRAFAELVSSGVMSFTEMSSIWRLVVGAPEAAVANQDGAGARRGAVENRLALRRSTRFRVSTIPCWTRPR